MTKNTNLFKKIAIAVSLLSLGFASSSFAATAAATTNVTPAQRAQIEEVVHQYLLQKPEVIMEAVQSLQRKQYEQAEKTVKQTQAGAGQYADVLLSQTNDPVAGNPNGKVTVVEFFDYQCPHCVDMAPVISDVIKANPDLRIVFKEFPIRGPVSEFAAKAALAANMQGKYYEFQHALLTSTQPLTTASVLSIAKATGLDVDKLKVDMDSSTINAQLKANIKLAQDLKLFGTPAFFVGKTSVAKNAPSGAIKYVPGQVNQEQLQKLINDNK